MAKTSLDKASWIVEEGDTLARAFVRRASNYPNHIAYREKRFGIWNEIRWGESYEHAKNLALGLVSLGLERGDRVGLIGDSGPELYWGLAATLLSGGTVFGMPLDALSSELKHLCGFPEAKFIFTADQEQVDKFITPYRDREGKDHPPLVNEIPSIKKIIWCDPKGLTTPEYSSNPWLISFTEVIELGRQLEQKSSKLFEEIINRIEPEDVAFLYYTSGTTGLPKSAMRTHRSLVQIRRQLRHMFPISAQDGTICHFGIAGMGDPMIGWIPHVTEGLVLNFAESPETVQEDMREVAPRCLMYFPRYWEDLASTVLVRVNEAGFLKKGMFDLFLPLGQKLADKEMKGQKINLLWRFLRKIAFWLAFRPALDKIGVLQTQWGVTMGYLLGPHTFRFLRAIGFDLRQVFAATEQGVVAAHIPGDIRMDSVGKVVEGVDVRVSDEGELLMRSTALFSGYYKNPEATAKAVDKFGFFHTGDAVSFDASGHLFYVDRASELRALSSGMKFSPQYVEAQMRFGAYVKDCIALGDENKDYVSVILIIDFKAVTNWAERRKIAFTTFADLSQKDEVGRLVLDDIMRVNSTLPEFARIKKYAMLHKELDPDEEELTRTRKLKRAVVENKYSGIINAIYTNKESVREKTTFTYKDGTTGTIESELKIRDVSKEMTKAGKGKRQR